MKHSMVHLGMIGAFESTAKCETGSRIDSELTYDPRAN